MNRAAVAYTEPRMEQAVTETALLFRSGEIDLPGILHQPQAPHTRGLVLVVGGPQYRVGSHRQFVLLARAVSAAGHPVLRFDYRGMGDAAGVHPGFLDVGEDIGAAVDALLERIPTLRDVVLWGLCDGATAAAMYAPGDPRVTGLVLLNPWVHSERRQARAYLRHYYLQRLLNRDFWLKVARGGFNPLQSLRGLVGDARASVGAAQLPGEDGSADAGEAGVDLVSVMADAIAGFSGHTLLVTSGQDLTAAEFEDAAGADRRLRRALSGPRVRRERLAECDHTFSRAAWRQQVERLTVEWMGSH